MKGPVTQGVVRHLLTHKENTIEMVELIIKETDLDPCAEQTTEETDLDRSCAPSGLFNLSRLRLFSQTLFLFLFTLFLMVCFDFR